MTATWTPNKYIITYYSNYGSGSGEAKSFKENYDTYHRVYDNTNLNFNRSGYEFTGWNTKSNGRGTAYSASSNILVQGNVSLYAQWRALNYLQFRYYKNHVNADDITGTTPNTYGDFGKPYTVSNCGYSFAEHVFVGWSVEPTRLAGPFYEGYQGTWTHTATIDLYALWMKKASEIKIYKANTSQEISRLDFNQDLNISWVIDQWWDYRSNSSSVYSQGVILKIKGTDEQGTKELYRKSFNTKQTSWHLGKLKNIPDIKRFVGKDIIFEITKTFGYNFKDSNYPYYPGYQDVNTGNMKIFEISDSISKTLESAGTANIKIGNTWKQGQVFIKLDGGWKEATSVFTRNANEWKESV
jgi:uncharacterized repeat protein (TIGR02543 family)